MQILRFQAGGQSFAVDTRRVVEVTPWVNLRPVPHAPSYLLGLVNFRGKVLPVIDLGSLLGSTPSRQRLSTRIIIVDTGGNDAEHSLLGLLAERVCEIRKTSEEGASSRPLALPDAPYLGPVLEIEGELVQFLLVEHITPEFLVSS